MEIVIYLILGIIYSRICVLKKWYTKDYYLVLTLFWIGYLVWDLLKWITLKADNFLQFICRVKL